MEDAHEIESNAHTDLDLAIQATLDHPEPRNEPHPVSSCDSALQEPLVERRSPSALFILCLWTIAKRLKWFCNTRLYPPTTPLLEKAFEQALGVYDLAPLTLLDDQRCFERLRAAKAAKLKKMRSKVKAAYEQHRVEEVPSFALCSTLDDASLEPLKSVLGMLSSPEFSLRVLDKKDLRAKKLRSREAKWVSTIENRPPENVVPQIESVSEGKLTNSETLKLIRQSVTNIGCGFIAERLVSGRKLVELSLQNCQITCAGAVLLANALKVSKALQYLDLSNSDSKAFCGHIFDNDVREVGASALALALEENRSLGSLSLSCNHIGSQGALAMARMLQVNGALRELDLSKTRLGNAAEELIESFRRSKTLDTLKLEWCSLRPGLGTQLAAIQAAKLLGDTPTNLHLLQ